MSQLARKDHTCKSDKNKVFIQWKIVLIVLKITELYDFKGWKNYEKCFLFHLKSSFRSRDI